MQTVEYPIKFNKKEVRTGVKNNDNTKKKYKKKFKKFTSSIICDCYIYV